MGEWKNVERPQYLGAKREQRFKEWDEQFGSGNWRLSWKVGETYVDLLGACTLYEDGYFNFLLQNQNVLQQLINDASEVYDDQLSNIGSGFNYLAQETDRTHLQDIALRRSLVRMGLWFKGSEPIRIRQELGTHPLSITLSPGRIPFHRPDLIEQPELQRWWHPHTIESFYQSNRYLQARS
ncbi:MAG: hypothetical protein M1142_03215 [Patescibacteria group bacterium]|nr:hypothetical protein [Patescibacteria group bacterium]